MPAIQATTDSTTLCLVRHGETDWNTERRLQGHLDVPLNASGQSQALATAAALSAHRFDALYSSDLARARQTITPVADSARITPVFDAALRERHYGDFQGLTYAEAKERYPHEYERFIGREPGFRFPGGGESLLAFSARVSTAIERIARNHAGERILVVTHGGVLDIVHRLASNTALHTPRSFTIPNAALNWVSFETGAWRLISWAQQTHLANAIDELPRT